ncbi:CHEK2 [Mytilus coruscus]|uniref:CHEK2 n=1 Tax=Mytilus coruscus TaxID=42192 RepID=A0A6J8DGN5_MYTCO|nr:CHEK2 [Mytilus coruscus]
MFGFGVANFKVPLPVKKRPIISLETESLEDIGLPSFSKKDFSDITIIGKGSYGKVYKAVKKKKEFVIQELSVADNFPLFIKVAKMMKTVQGHENVLQIHGFSYKDKAILLDYISFSFEKIEIEQDTVDLKPENVLVTNNHVATTDAEYWWSERPIVAILSDFGEARSSLIQTKILAETSTHNLFRGSPAYMAPKALLGDSSRGTIQDLLKIDIWSFGIVLFHLIYSDTVHPYADEIKQNTVRPIEALKKLVSKKALPRPSEKYSYLQNKQLKSTFYKCAKFDASCRPTAEILKNYFDVPSVELPPHVGSKITIDKASIAEVASENIEKGTLLKNSPTKYLEIDSSSDEDSQPDNLRKITDAVEEKSCGEHGYTEYLPELRHNCKPRAESVNVKSLRTIMRPENILKKPTIAEIADGKTDSPTKFQKTPTNFLNFVNTSIEEDDDLYLASKSIEDREEVIKCFKKHRNKEFLPEQWNTCTSEHVAALPADKDDLVKYTITCDMNDMMKCTKDGRSWGRWKISSDIIKKEIRNNMNAKPSIMVNDKLVDLMSSDSFAWREIEEVAENFADMKRVYNARDNMKKEINPCGQNFEALAIYSKM